jgi:hypothetical protein
MKLAGAGVTQDPTIFTTIQSKRQPQMPSESSEEQAGIREIQKKRQEEHDRQAMQFAKIAYNLGRHWAYTEAEQRKLVGRSRSLG